MGVENIHPVALKRLEASLPTGSQITQAMARDLSSSVLMVLYRNTVKKVTLPKTSVNLITGTSAEVYADEGEALVSVIQRYLDKYQLYALNGIDYTQSSVGKVQFDGKEKITCVLPILFDSITLTGEMVFVIKNRPFYERPKDPVKVNIDQQKVALAIASLVFQGDKDNRIFTGNQLSTQLATRLNTYLNGIPLAIRFTVEDFALAKVLKTLHDGVTQIALVKTAGNFLFALRYQTVSWDAPFSQSELVLDTLDYGQLKLV